MKMLDDIKIKIEEINKSDNPELIKGKQNYSKNKQTIDKMIESLKEEITDISKNIPIEVIYKFFNLDFYK